jgi:hypothetical protein
MFAATDVQKIQVWIEALDSNKFAERERASQELGLILDEAEPYLKKARESKRSAEAQRRIDALLHTRSLGFSGNELRKLRVIEILEHIAGSGADATRPGAIDILKKLAAGDLEAPTTQEARASLDRLEWPKAGH